MRRTARQIPTSRLQASFANSRPAEAQARSGRRAAASQSWGEWIQARDRYLADFDPALVDNIKTHLTRRRDALARAGAGAGSRLGPYCRVGALRRHCRTLAQATLSFVEMPTAVSAKT